MGQTLKLVVASAAAVCLGVYPAHADQLNGRWSGQMHCGPLSNNPDKSPAFDNPISMVVSGKSATATRDTAKVIESLQGSIAGGKNVSLSGEGKFKDGSGKPWIMKIDGAFSSGAFTGSGGIFAADGSKWRDCGVKLSLVEPEQSTVLPKPVAAPIEKSKPEVAATSAIPKPAVPSIFEKQPPQREPKPVTTASVVKQDAAPQITKAETSVPQSKTSGENDLEQQLVKAAMGHLQQNITTTCPKRKNQNGQMLATDEKCETSALAEIVARDEEQSINAVNDLLIKARIAVGQSNREAVNNIYYQCHLQGGEWSQFVLHGVTSLAIKGETAEYSSARIKSMIEGIKKQCNPQEAQQFINVVAALARTLDPIRMTRQKDAERLKLALNDSLRTAREEGRAEKEASQIQAKATEEQRKLAEEHKKIAEEKGRVDSVSGLGVKSVEEYREALNRMRSQGYSKSDADLRDFLYDEIKGKKIGKSAVEVRKIDEEVIKAKQENAAVEAEKKRVAAEAERAKQYPFIAKLNPVPNNNEQVRTQVAGAVTTCQRHTEAIKRSMSGVALNQLDLKVDNPNYERNARLEQFMKMELLGTRFKPEQAREHIMSGQFYSKCMEAYNGY